MMTDRSSLGDGRRRFICHRLSGRKDEKIPRNSQVGPERSDLVEWRRGTGPRSVVADSNWLYQVGRPRGGFGGYVLVGGGVRRGGCGIQRGRTASARDGNGRPLWRWGSRPRYVYHVSNIPSPPRERGHVSSFTGAVINQQYF